MPCRWRSQISLVLGKLLIASTLVILKKLLIVSAIVLTFVRDMKCILAGKERVGGEEFWARMVEVWTAFYYSR